VITDLIEKLCHPLFLLIVGAIIVKVIAPSILIFVILLIVMATLRNILIYSVRKIPGTECQNCHNRLTQEELDGTDGICWGCWKS
jgi:hypothetical protein